MAEPRPASRRADVGARVRTLRERRGFSLSALARAAGIGKGSLSELESGRRNPTLDTLYAVAGPLNVPLTALVGEELGTETSDLGDPDTALLARLLHVEHHRDGSTTEVFWLRIGPGSRESPAHGPGVREHLRVMRGQVTAGPLGAQQGAVPGETIEWAADVPHSYGSDGGAVAVLTIDSPAATGAAPTAPQSQLLVIAGVPGVGKTTAASVIARRWPATHVSIDAVEESLLAAGLPAGRTVGVAAYETARAIAELNLRAGHNVVIDAVNDSDAARQTWRNAADAEHAELRFVELICSDPREHRHRLETRTRPFRQIPEPSWGRVLARGESFAAWTDDHLALDTAQTPPEDIVATVLQWMIGHKQQKSGGSCRYTT